MIVIFGGVGIGLGVLRNCWGEWGLEGTRDDKITP